MGILKGALVFISLIALSVPAFAIPSEIIIIRHAEKPESGSQLSPKGFQRANALPQFFAKYPVPVAIYAAGVKQDGPTVDEPEKSVRSIQTVMPLAKKLNLKIHVEFTKKETEELVQAVMATPQYDGGLVVICWEHKVIQTIAQELGFTNAPQWPDDVFDRAWILNFSNGHFVNASNVGQHLLPGDSP